MAWSKPQQLAVYIKKEKNIYLTIDLLLPLLPFLYIDFGSTFRVF